MKRTNMILIMMRRVDTFGVWRVKIGNFITKKIRKPMSEENLQFLKL